MTDTDWLDDEEPRSALCSCGDRTYNPRLFSSCYDCFLERRVDYLSCIWCGRWHSPRFSTCYQCRTIPGRDEASSHLRRMVLARDYFKCRYCGSEEDLQVDHIKPCAEGGTADPWNLQTLCGRCNKNKGATWWTGGSHDKARERSLHAYATYLWQYLTTDEQTRLWAEISDWLVLDTAAQTTAARTSP